MLPNPMHVRLLGVLPHIRKRVGGLMRFLRWIPFFRTRAEVATVEALTEPVGWDPPIVRYSQGARGRWWWNVVNDADKSLGKSTPSYRTKAEAKAAFAELVNLTVLYHEVTK